MGKNPKVREPIKDILTELGTLGLEPVELDEPVAARAAYWQTTARLLMLRGQRYRDDLSNANSKRDRIRNQARKLAERTAELETELQQLAYLNLVVKSNKYPDRAAREILTLRKMILQLSEPQPFWTSPADRAAMIARATTDYDPRDGDRLEWLSQDALRSEHLFRTLQVFVSAAPAPAVLRKRIDEWREQPLQDTSAPPPERRYVTVELTVERLRAARVPDSALELGTLDERLLWLIDFHERVLSEVGTDDVSELVELAAVFKGETRRRVIAGEPVEPLPVEPSKPESILDIVCKKDHEHGPKCLDLIDEPGLLLSAIKSAMRLGNGYVATFAKDGKQIPELQGPYSDELAARIIALSDESTEFVGVWPTLKAERARRRALGVERKTENETQA